MQSQHASNRMAAYSTPVILSLLLLGLVVLVAVFGDKALARTAAETLVRVVLVVSLWIFVGNSGVISFGHAGYMAIGAYCSAWLTLKPQSKALFLPGLSLSPMRYRSLAPPAIIAPGRLVCSSDSALRKCTWPIVGPRPSCTTTLSRPAVYANSGFTSTPP